MESKIRSALVIGGVNVDICGYPSNAICLHDSNPGHVKFNPGGVGRNIAHNLSLLGMKTDMLTAIGGDSFSGFVREALQSAGIGTAVSETFPDMASSVYMYITDSDGDMLVAVSDMDIVSMITPDVIRKRLDIINSYDAVVIDANLSQETIIYIAENCTAPLFADPVSGAKAPKLIPVLKYLHAVKPNMLEAAVLSGCDDPNDAADKLLSLGTDKVFISLGSRGILAADNSSRISIPAEIVNVVNTNGAGDAASAAMIYGCTAGMNLEETGKLCVKAGALTSSTNETNFPGLSSILADISI